MAVNPRTDEQFITVPPLFALIKGKHFLKSSNCPNTFTSKISLRPSLGISSIAPGIANAPLLNKASNFPPHSLSTLFIALVMELEFKRSKEKLLRPFFLRTAESFAFLQVAYTSQPFLCRAIAVSKPMPLEQPVISIDFLFSIAFIPRPIC